MSRMTHAQQWSRLLVAAMAARGMSNRRLADAIGVNMATVQHWRTGRRQTPTLPHATAAAEALGWPSLATYAARRLSAACAVCGTSFQAARVPAKFCSPRCRRVHDQRRQTNARASAASLDKHRLALYREAVGRYCRRCEPAGMCVMPECDLRDVSPLPLVAREQVA